MRRVLPGLAVLLAISAAQPALAGEVPLLRRGSLWRYLDDGSDPGTVWRQPSFDDATWRRGPGELGYGDGDEVTTLRCRQGLPPGSPCPNDGESDHILTTYLRRGFRVRDPSLFDSLQVNLRVDDGAVLYLNGQEVLRVNLPPGEIRHDTAAFLAADNMEGSFTLAAEPLRAGLNLLAVEVHQVSRQSSDLSFDLGLVGNAPLLPDLLQGPYLQTGTPQGGVLRWRTGSPVPSRVELGQTPDRLTTVLFDPTPRRSHEVTITGLAPGTRYFYTLGHGVHDAQTLLDGDEERFFLTPPPPGTRQATRIWVIGDSGTNGRRPDLDPRPFAVFDAYRRLSAGEPTDLWLMLGDNAYNRGTAQEYQRAVFDVYALLLQNAWLWPALGNHDVDEGFSDSPSQSGVYFDLFTLPRSGEAGGLASGTEAYYSFDFANVHFVCLDSSDSDLGPQSPMLAWLTQDLLHTAPSQDWIVAYWHHPPYTKGSHDSDRPNDSEGRLFQVRQEVLPILEAAGVDLVLTGHSHSYERSFLLHGHYGTSNTLCLPGDACSPHILDDGDGRLTGDGAYAKPSRTAGAVYAVAGSSGQTGPVRRHPVMAVWLEELGSLILDVDGLELRARFLNDRGVIQDQFTLVKHPGTCRPDATTVCVNGARFSVVAQWQDAAGNSGQGFAEKLTDDTGSFWFFNPENVEVVVKVLDACADPSQSFWVFATGLTDVHVHITVTDTVTGEIWEATNPLGVPFLPLQATDAFATCP